MPGQLFDNIQEIVDERTIEVTGTVEVTEEYCPVELMVGLVQVKSTKDAQGNESFDLDAGAYGMGYANVAPLARGQMRTESRWSMHLQLDSNEDKQDFKEGKAYGFVMVKQTGNAFTGWLDQVELKKKAKPKAAPEHDGASVADGLLERAVR
jgi:hypothetical protein